MDTIQSCGSRSFTTVLPPRHLLHTHVSGLQQLQSILAALLPSIFVALGLLAIDACNTTEPPQQQPLADTTSHDFTWTVETLGDGSASMLRDVAIIHDTMAYAVGEMFMREPSGQDNLTPFCIATWNGSNWELKRLYYNGSTIITYVRGLQVSDANSIWLSAGSVFRWDGVGYQSELQFSRLSLPDSDGSVEKLLGVSSVQLYGVGNSGTIIFFDGTHWRQMSSGTKTDLRDITGGADGSTLWACGYSNDNSNSVLLAFKGQSWSTIWSRQGTSIPPYGDLVMSVWVYGQTLYTATNTGVFKQPVGSAVSSATKMLTLDAAPYRIRGSGHNNIVVVGDQAKIWHYNGATWKQLNVPDPNRPLYSVAVSATMIIAVGADYNSFPARAVVYMGKR